MTWGYGRFNQLFDIFWLLSDPALQHKQQTSPLFLSLSLSISHHIPSPNSFFKIYPSLRAVSLKCPIRIWIFFVLLHRYYYLYIYLFLYSAHLVYLLGEGV